MSVHSRSLVTAQRRAVAIVIALALTLSALVAGFANPAPASAATVLGQRIADIASAQVGASESPLGSNRVPGKPYGNLGQAWCAHFVSWALKSAGINPTGPPRGAFNTNVARAWSVTGKAGGYGRTASTRNAQVGDLLIDRYDGTANTGGHISIVVAVNVDGYSDLVTTVGGNESDRVTRATKDLDLNSRYLVTVAEVRNSTPVTPPTGPVTAPTTGPFETYEAPAVDFDNDARSDLAFLKTKATPSGKVEVHVASSASNYQQFLVHQASALSVAEAASGTFAIGDREGDRGDDLFLLKTANTASGKIEVHVLDRSSGYTAFSAHTVTPLVLGEAANGQFMLSDVDGDRRSDLAYVKTRGTSTGKIELHVLSGRSDFQTFISHAVTPLVNAEAGNGSFSFGDVDGDGRSDFGYAKTRSTAGNIEVHVASAASGFGTLVIQKITPMAASLAQHSTLQLAQIDSDGKADLVAIQRAATSTNTIEVHAVSASSQFQTWITHSASGFSLADAGNGTFRM